MRLLGRSSSPAAEQVTCGCCQRQRPRTGSTELCGSPGVFICRRCAAWAATRFPRR